MAEKDDNKGRDARGRFAAGNTGGPGGPRRRASELRRAAQDAVEPEHVRGLMRRALRMGLEGNLSASRFVMEQAAGRVPDAPTDPEAVAVALPPLRTAADCNLAIERLIDGIVQGTIERDDAKVLIDAVHTRLKGIETRELEERLAELEKAAQSVDHGRTNNRRGRFST